MKIEIKRSKRKLVQSWWSSKHVPVTPALVRPPLHPARSPQTWSAPDCSSKENTPGFRAVLLNGSNQAKLLTLKLLNTIALHQITALRSANPWLEANSFTPGSWACPRRSSPVACRSAVSRTCDCPGNLPGLAPQGQGCFPFDSFCDHSRRLGSRF